MTGQYATVENGVTRIDAADFKRMSAPARSEWLRGLSCHDLRTYMEYAGATVERSGFGLSVFTSDEYIKAERRRRDVMWRALAKEARRRAPLGTTITVSLTVGEVDQLLAGARDRASRTVVSWHDERAEKLEQIRTALLFNNAAVVTLTVDA